MKSTFGLCVIGSLLLAPLVNASPITFATWAELTGGGNLFEYLNSGAHAGANSIFETGTGTTPTSVPILFEFENVGGALPPALQTAVNAHMTISAPEDGLANSTVVCLNPPACTNNKYFTTQPVQGTITITADSPVAGLNNNPSDNLLLQVTFTGSAGLSGFRGDSVASLLVDSISAGDAITFSSDYLNFAVPIENQVSMSFTTVTPCFTRNTLGNCGANVNSNVGSYLHQFTAHGDGSFAADPQPLARTPEPEQMELIGTGLIALSLLGARAIKKGRSA